MTRQFIARFCSIFTVALVAACTSDATPAPTQLAADPTAGAFSAAEWSTPVHLDAPVNSAFRELGPALSPDELSLYFGSDRPGSIGGPGDIDIWAVRRECVECPWGAPVHLNINSAQSDGAPSFSPDGHTLFFSSNRNGTHGGDDIWVVSRDDKDDDLGWGTPINLGPGVNTSDPEGQAVYVPALHAEGANLYFARGGGAATDIYRTLVTLDGQVLDVATPVTELNDPAALDGGPAISHNGKEIFFWSGRVGGFGDTDLWVATRKTPHDSWSAPENVGAVINTRGGELTPSLSHDGRTLLWSASMTARPSLGRQDIWMSTRR
jgi:hypothetical protein